MRELTVSTPSGGIQLAGSLCLPEGAGPFPTVLMMHGTGPLDRDGNMPGQALNVFNTIAHSLAADGIGSLRYDKRGCGHSEGDYYTAGHTDLVADAAAWLQTLRARAECDPERLFVLGHSEGCLIAPQVALANPPVAGLALLCPFVQPVEQLLMRQAEAIQQDLEQMPGLAGWIQRSLARLMGGVVNSQKRLIERIKTSPEASFRAGFQQVPAKATRELIQIDPAAVFAQVETPMLLVAGSKDMQCDPADAERIAALARGEVEVHVLDDLVHVLRRDPGSPSLLGVAKLLDQPIDPAVVQLIHNWLKARLKDSIATPHV